MHLRQSFSIHVLVPSLFSPVYDWQAEAESPLLELLLLHFRVILCVPAPHELEHNPISSHSVHKGQSEFWHFRVFTSPLSSQPDLSSTAPTGQFRDLDWCPSPHDTEHVPQWPHLDHRAKRLGLLTMLKVLLRLTLALAYHRCYSCVAIICLQSIIV